MSPRVSTRIVVGGFIVCGHKSNNDDYLDVTGDEWGSIKLISLQINSRYNAFSVGLLAGWLAWPTKRSPPRIILMPRTDHCDADDYISSGKTEERNGNETEELKEEGGSKVRNYNYKINI